MLDCSEEAKMPENKKVDFRFEGSTLIVAVDTNKDGQPVLELKFDMAEIPDEIWGMMNKNKGE